MKKAHYLAAIIIAAALLAGVSAPVHSVVPIVHPTSIVLPATLATEKPYVKYRGINGVAPASRSAFPGYFDIDPGTNWRNFVTVGKTVYPYTVKNVTLKKMTPGVIQCADVFLPRVITQEGTMNIRLHWPLMYETPGTTWTLTILYGTALLWDDDGAGPNPASNVHVDQWVWKCEPTWDSMLALVELFHEISWGTSEVPLVGSDTLYVTLGTYLTYGKFAVQTGNKAVAAMYLSDFELTVMDACIASAPDQPYASNSGYTEVPWLGIANTAENPACCKLLVDAEYMVTKYGLDF